MVLTWHTSSLLNNPILVIIIFLESMIGFNYMYTHIFQHYFQLVLLLTGYLTSSIGLALIGILFQSMYLTSKQTITLR